MKTKKILSSLCSILALASLGNAQSYIGVDSNQPVPLASDAGTADTICATASITLGGAPTATNGTSPYTYMWSPSANLDDETNANPVGFPPSSVTYYVTVTDANNCQSIDSVIVTVDPCAGEEELGVAFGTSIQPNPSNGLFQLNIANPNSSDKIEIVITDPYGKVIHQAQMNNIKGVITKQFDLREYATGIYLVQVNNGNEQNTIKLNKTK